MTHPAAKLLSADPVKLAIAAAIVGGVGYLLLRQAFKDVGKAGAAAANAAGGLVTGNNPITQGTPYEGTGVFGTLGGATNRAIPILDDIGSWLGGKIFEWTHPEWNKTTPPITATDDQDERSWWQF